MSERIELKMRDVFYNNGITNIFWATLKSYDLEYEENENGLKIEKDGIRLILRPFMLEITGDKESIKEWYRGISFYLTKIGLFEIDRVVYNFEKEKLEEGYSLGIKPFALRTWGTSIGSKFISAPSLWKNLSQSEINKLKKAIKEYENKTGKSLEVLVKDNLFKKKWEKEGVYIQVAKKEIISKLAGDRGEFEEGNNNCEICGSSYTQYKHNKVFKRDTSVLPTIIGLEYSGFKDLTIGKNTVCAFCDLVLRYNFFWTFYVKAKKSIILHINIPDLIALFELKNGLFNIKMEDITGENIKQSTNIPYQGFYIPSPERALLALSLFVYKLIKEKQADEKLQLLFAKKKEFLQIAGILFDNQGIYQFIEYHKLSKFLEFLDKLPDITLLSQPLGKNTFMLNKGEHKGIYERPLLLNLLEFKPISKNLAEIAFFKIKKEMNQSYLSKNFEEMISIFYQFLTEEEFMEKEAIEIIRKYGWAIGTIAKAIEDKGIFYELRDAKHKEQFVKVLRDFSFRMIKKAEDLREKFDKTALNTFTGRDQEFINLLYGKGDRWEEIRDLLAFFSVNNYLKDFSSQSIN